MTNELQKISKKGMPGQKKKFLSGTKIVNTRKNLFYSRVLLPNENGCMLWTGGINDSGYGVLHNYKRISGTAVTLAHRYSYQLHYGINPEKMFVCHTCDIPACVSPDHLFLGSYLDNINDMNNKKRQAWGEKNGHSKLTANQVIGIKELLRYGVTPTQIAKAYGLSHPTIHNIKTGTTWGNLT